MCMSAMAWAAMGGVVWGTSVAQLREFGIRQILIPANAVIAPHPSTMARSSATSCRPRPTRCSEIDSAPDLRDASTVRVLRWSRGHHLRGPTDGACSSDPTPSGSTNWFGSRRNAHTTWSSVRALRGRAAGALGQFGTPTNWKCGTSTATELIDIGLIAAEAVNSSGVDMPPVRGLGRDGKPP
jgi:hypothetical protein